jgi:hypothetical protein
LRAPGAISQSCSTALSRFSKSFATTIGAVEAAQKLSLTAAGSSRSMSVTAVQLALLDRQLAQATAELLTLLLAGAIVRLALFGRREAKTLPA